MIHKLKPEGTHEVLAPDGEVVELPTAPRKLIKLNGPMMTISVSPAAEEINTNQNHAFSCHALIDTGASISAVSPNVVEQLGLSETGFQSVMSVHNIEVRPVYFGRLTFPWGAVIETELVCCELQGLDCLIGRDVLCNWFMAYDGVNGEITICD